MFGFGIGINVRGSALSCIMKHSNFYNRLRIPSFSAHHLPLDMDFLNMQLLAHTQRQWSYSRTTQSI